MCPWCSCTRKQIAVVDAYVAHTQDQIVISFQGVQSFQKYPLDTR